MQTQAYTSALRTFRMDIYLLHPPYSTSVNTELRGGFFLVLKDHLQAREMAQGEKHLLYQCED